MPFEKIKAPVSPELTIQTTLDLPTNGTATPKKTRKKTPPRAELERPGFGPFNLAKGADVEYLITDWPSAVAALDTEEWIALDLETSGLNPWRDWIAVVGLYGPKTKTAAVIHVQGDVPDGFLYWLDSRPRKFVTQNGLNFDMLFMFNNGMDIFKHEWYDTYIGEQVITLTNRRGVKKDLASIVKRRLGYDIDKDVDHRDWLADTLSDRQIRYVAEDISFLPAIRDAQYAKAAEVDATVGLSDWYKTGLVHALDFEMDLLPIVAQMECRGLPLDAGALEEYYVSQIIESSNAKRDLDAMFGEVNWNSHVQVKRAFREVFGIQLPSTQEDELINIHDMSVGSPIQPAIKTLITYKHAAKRAGMYNGEFYDKYTVDGWLRAQFRPTGTDTGRFSSANPNLQQIPKNKGEKFGRGMRHVFGNLDGFQIVAIDYSQIEFRVAANEANDTAALTMFRDGSYDVHTMVAAQVFNVPPSAVTKDQRQLSKAMSFTLLFGGGAGLLSSYAKSLGEDLPISRAKPIVEAFFDQFQGLRRMREKAYGMAATGRPYRLRQPTGLQRVLTRETGDLRATLMLNNIVQGTAAAGLKYALKEARRRGLTGYIGAVVHDEIVSTVPNGEALEFSREMTEAMIVGMERVCENAKVVAEASIGATWG